MNESRWRPSWVPGLTGVPPTCSLIPKLHLKATPFLGRYRGLHSILSRGNTSPAFELLTHRQCTAPPKKQFQSISSRPVLFICIPFLICYHFQPLLPLCLSFCFSSQGCAQRTHSYTRLLSPRRGKARAMLPHRTTYWPGRIKLSLTGVRSIYIFKGCRGGGVLFMTALSTTNQLDFRSCCALNRSQQLH